MKPKLKLICLLLVTVFIFSSTTIALASPSITWVTNSAYYNDDGNFIISGYFYNDGTKIVTKVNWIEVKVYFKQDYTNWWLGYHETWSNFDVYLNPGERSQTFLPRIPNSHNDYWYNSYRINTKQNFRFTTN